VKPQGRIDRKAAPEAAFMGLVGSFLVDSSLAGGLPALLFSKCSFPFRAGAVVKTRLPDRDLKMKQRR
jgi:hypothetical protein